MDRLRVAALLEAVKEGQVEPKDALAALSALPFIETRHGHVDTHRALRQGIPEVIFGAAKRPEQIVELVAAQRGAGLDAMVTRIDDDAAEQVLGALPGGHYEREARVLWYGPAEPPFRGDGSVAVVSAGTSDDPVATEARIVARFLGNRVEQIRDVGVAGIQRLLAYTEVLQRARVSIVIAGMEGALPTAVAGLVPGVVIAVPTSVGYGANFGGLSALLGMMSSCAANVSVVNIDNGFGAAYVATLINRL